MGKPVNLHMKCSGQNAILNAVTYMKSSDSFAGFWPRGTSWAPEKEKATGVVHVYTVQFDKNTSALQPYVYIHIYVQSTYKYAMYIYISFLSTCRSGSVGRIRIYIYIYIY